MSEQAVRERSTVKFPYGDLEDAVEIASTIHKNYGLSCSIEQLAGALGQSISGAFRTKVATAGTFGAIETGHRAITLTELGERLVDETDASARAEAFLTVPLYRQVLDAFRARRLPEDAGLEAELTRMGVSAKQASKARQALMRSAEQAGFFRHGRDRLVEPAASKVAAMPTAAPEKKPEAPPERAPAMKHHLIQGLWDLLPDMPGGTFSPEQQEAWLDAARVNLKLLYGSSTKSEQGGGSTPPNQPRS